MTQKTEFSPFLSRIADALDRLTPRPPKLETFNSANAYIWQGASSQFQPVLEVNRVPLELLQAIDDKVSELLENTRRFANGLPANNALLWGARGMGKSSLIKAVHGELSLAHCTEGQTTSPLKLIEIHREDISTLPACLAHMRASEHRFVVFCDDLSFDRDDTSYKSLKAVLEGGIEGRPDNVLFYATSNRRHLMPRDMMENERSTAINPSEAIEEKVSLSDRFGLWLGFHNATQDDYLKMINAYVAHFGLEVEADKLRRDALEWSMTRGARSGRVAWQFIQHLAGTLNQPLKSQD
ncbi:MAG: ATP-binding protein [Hyphomicrobiaceae bacterium]